jgi:predicted ribosomally synthesized peptide with SipW-like signal peptide
MKKILMSILTIAIVSVVAVGFTKAYFTDTQAVTDNTLTAGKVNIDVRPGTPMNILLDTTQSFKGGLVPGQYDPTLFEVNVYNQGWGVSTIPVKYRFTTEFVSQSVGGYWDLLWVKVHHTYAGTPNPASWPVVYEGLLKNLNLNSVDNAIADFIDPNITHVYYFEYGLDSTTGNIYQGANAKFNLRVDATQSTNPGWSE